MGTKDWIDAVAGSCRERVAATRIYNRVGVVGAIEFLEKTKNSNKEMAALMRKEWDEGRLASQE